MVIIWLILFTVRFFCTLVVPLLVSIPIPHHFMPCLTPPSISILYQRPKLPPVPLLSISFGAPVPLRDPIAPPLFRLVIIAKVNDLHSVKL